MGLADMMTPGAKSKKGPIVEIDVEPMDPLDAAARLLKAIESKDVHAIDDALRLHYEACEGEDDEREEKSESDKP